MERKRCIYATARQKKKLFELISKNPELISCKAGQGFNYKDSQKLWQNIAVECNALAGARKTWRQWKKTWQDIRSKNKKKQKDVDTELTSVTLSEAEQEVLGIKNTSTNFENSHEQPEFVQLDQDESQDGSGDIDFTFSEPESPPESKVFTRSNSVFLKEHQLNP